MHAHRPESDKQTTPDLTELMRGGFRLTPVTIALIGANVAIFLIMLAYGAGLWHSPNDVQLEWGANFGPATGDGEWWRLATAMFLHFGLVHLAMNMWALWDSGRLAERLYGHVRFVTIYFASGLAGNLLSLVTHGNQAVSGGASGAIFGVLGALLVCLWRERRQVDPTEFRWLFGGVVVFTVVTIVLGLLITGIDNAAHIGGLISGSLLGIVLARPLSATSPKPGAHRWLAAGALGLAVAALGNNIPAPSYLWHDELQAREAIREFLSGDQRIQDRWQTILNPRNGGSRSFEELAGRIETDVTNEYRESFETLSALELDPLLPSAATVEILKKYARLREEASKALADALRFHDQKRIREALEMMRRAPYVARGIPPPPAPDVKPDNRVRPPYK